MIAHETKLIIHVINPTMNAFWTPHFTYTAGVIKTLRIYPTSGNINTFPAYFPIQEEAIVA